MRCAYGIAHATAHSLTVSNISTLSGRVGPVSAGRASPPVKGFVMWASPREGYGDREPVAHGGGAYEAVQLAGPPSLSHCVAQELVR